MNLFVDALLSVIAAAAAAAAAAATGGERDAWAGAPALHLSPLLATPPSLHYAVHQLTPDALQSVPLLDSYLPAELLDAHSFHSFPNFDSPLENPSLYSSEYDIGSHHLPRVESPLFAAYPLPSSYSALLPSPPHDLPAAPAAPVAPATPAAPAAPTTLAASSEAPATDPAPSSEHESKSKA